MNEKSCRSAFHTISLAPLNAVTHVIWPGLSTAFLIFIGFYSMKDLDARTTAIGVGELLLGFVPLALGAMQRRGAEVAAG